MENRGEIEEIVAYRSVHHTQRKSQLLRREFLVKFRDQPEIDNSWLSEDQLRRAGWQRQGLAKGSISSIAIHEAVCRKT